MTSPTNSDRLIFASRRAVRRISVGLALLLSLTGCSRGPAPLPMPSFDPAGSAAKAMDLYDTDGDGYVAGGELEKAPGLKAAMKNLDQNEDGKVSEQEIAERVQAWGRMRIGVMPFDGRVHLDGSPLADAQITLEPDEFLAGVVQAAVDTTSLGGTFSATVPKDKRPLADSPPGMQAGIYKVRVSKIVNGKEIIPAKYNIETILGQEVAFDDPAIANNQVVYKLKKN